MSSIRRCGALRHDASRGCRGMARENETKYIYTLYDAPDSRVYHTNMSVATRDKLFTRSTKNRSGGKVFRRFVLRFMNNLFINLMNIYTYTLGTNNYIILFAEYYQTHNNHRREEIFRVAVRAIPRRPEAYRHSISTATTDGFSSNRVLRIDYFLFPF